MVLLPSVMVHLWVTVKTGFVSGGETSVECSGRVEGCPKKSAWQGTPTRGAQKSRRGRGVQNELAGVVFLDLRTTVQ